MHYNIYPSRKKKGFFGRISNFSVTTKIIILTIIISIAELFLYGFFCSNTNKCAILDYSALNPSNILAGKYLWTILLHIFVHGSIFHLFINMFVLFSFGFLCERIIGRKRFLWLYLISGIFAGLLSVFAAGFFGYGIFENIFGSPTTYMVGASGALFGLIGLLSVLIPRKKVFLIAGPIILIILEVVIYPYVPENFQFLFYSIINLLMLLMVFSLFSPSSFFYKLSLPISMPFWLAPIVAIVPLTIIGFFVSLPIGNIAHFGGFIVGFSYGLYLRNKYKKKVGLLQQIIR